MSTEVDKAVSEALAKASFAAQAESDRIYFEKRRQEMRRPIDLNDMFQRPFGTARPVTIAQDAKPIVGKRATVLRAVQANAGLAVAYRRALERMISEMQASYLYWVKACYRQNEPVMAQDAVPAAELAATIRGLGRRWQRNFNRGAPELARWFAQRIGARSDAALMAILKKAGYTVKFTMTPAMRDIIRATVEENVGLIKSIPQQFHLDVQGAVMRSVQAGRDLEQLTNELEEKFGSTHARAKLIAIDQNNKATSALQIARQTELGIDEGIWQHCHCGRQPRRTHVANDGKRFKLAEGWFDPDPKVRRFIRPGEIIRCHCTWRAVVKGFS